MQIPEKDLLLVIYGKKHCVQCNIAKQIAKEYNIPYQYQSVGVGNQVDITKEQLENIVKRPVFSVPVITLNGKEIEFK